jgi:predicted permease
VIISALAGVGLSLSGLVLPGFLDRTLLMLGNLGLPLALLIIGATLAETPLKSGLVRLSGLACLKLLVAPGLGLVLLLLWPAPFLPAQAALILLCAPTATVTVILAWQMGGDPALASSAVSFTHALSPLAYYLWLYLGGILLK